MATTLLLLACLLIGSAAASEQIVIGGLHGLDPNRQEDSIHVRLAISGGGARGLTSIGVLRAFEERGIDVVAIAGTSIGGIVGGLYACGFSSEELTGIISEIDFNQLLQNNPPRRSMFLTKRQGQEGHLLSVRFHGIKPEIPQGLTSGQEVTSLLAALTNKAVYFAGRDFTRLPVPFRTVATDVVTGETVVLDHGSLADAMRATIAFPLAFTGVTIDGHLLMDGGMVMPIPVDLVLSMGDSSAPVVAINTTNPLRKRSALNTPVDIAGQVTSIMTADQLADQLSRADFVIAPCPDSISTADFDLKDSLIAIGYRAGLAVSDSIVSLAVERARDQPKTINRVRVQTTSRELADRLSLRFVERTLSRRQLVRELKQAVTDLQLFSLTAHWDTGRLDKRAGAGGQAMTLTLIPRDFNTLSGYAFGFRGNHYFTDSALYETASRRNIEKPQDIVDAANKVISYYRRHGYDLAYVDSIEVNHDFRTVTLAIDEVPLRRIDVHNNQRTRDWLIRSYFPLTPGEPYSTRRAADGLNNIYATDLFEQVSLNLIPTDSGAVVQIDADEREPLVLRLGWHWHDEYESEQFIEFIDENLFGIGMELLGHARYGDDRQRYSVGLRAHRIFSTYLTARVQAFYRRWDRTIFDVSGAALGFRREERTGFSMRIGQQIARLGTVSGGFDFERITQTDDRTGSSEQFDLRTLHVRSLVETFDRVPFPQSGEKHLVELTLAGKAMGGDVEFTRFFTSLEAYFPLGEFLNFHPRVSIGVSRNGLPASERFYVGGAHSLVGYRSDQLVGDKVFLLNNEIRFRLPLSLYLTARSDIGDVYGSTDQIKLKNLRYAYGLALAMNTPIGPFEFGYGISTDNSDRFYFNAGFAF